jgi:hypothetical protein
VALHEKIEFEKVAQFREAGNKFDRWTDVEYWQLLLCAFTVAAVVKMRKYITRFENNIPVITASRSR